MRKIRNPIVTPDEWPLYPMKVVLGCVLLLIGMSSVQYAQGQAVSRAANAAREGFECGASAPESVYFPVDSWIYPVMFRLYSMGYIDTVFLGVRPWTRASVARMLDDANDRILDAEEGEDATAAQARQIYDAVERALYPGAEENCTAPRGKVRLESVYSVTRAISGTPLRDSFHLGSTIINDYGRPYESGINSYSGASGYATASRFAVYLRGEFESAPSSSGYSADLAHALSTVDGTAYMNPTTGMPYSQATIPQGRIPTDTQGRFLEAYVSAQVRDQVLSFGKEDEWLGPALGASMAYSNNAENIYAFHINRSEPLDVPGLSRLTGPFRYEFLVGALRGHTLMQNPLYANNPSSQPNVINPGNPWLHVEKVSFRPTENLEFGFERTAIFGGEGHSPVTLHTFLKSFFSTKNVNAATKYGPSDPGARFGAFDFSYRLPFMRNWLTLYTDSEAHDDVSPISAPRRSAYRPGIYLSHMPGVPRLDLRIEAASTDPTSVDPGLNQYGQAMYWETVERQGYTNQGQLFGDWIGREAKGGQAWITYHLSGNEWLQLGLRNQKATKDFIPGSATKTISGSTTLIPGGTTLNDLSLQMVKRIGKDFEVNGNFALEHWKTPVYLTGEQTVTSTTIQVTWFPGSLNRF